METAELVKQYVPMGVGSLSVNGKHKFNLFQLDNESMRLFKCASLPLLERDLEKLETMGRSTLYVHKEQKSELYKHMRANIGQTLRDPQIPAEDKAAMLTETSAQALTEALDNPESTKSIKNVCIQGERHVTLALLGKNERMAMKSTPLPYPFALSHAMSVSTLSILLALVCGESDSHKLNEIASGALLHELGKTVLDPNYYTSKQSAGAQLHRRLHKYPEIGAKLAGNSSVSDGARKVVLEHQERLDGTGFPFALKGDDISFGSRIVAICDHFDERTNPTKTEGCEKPFDVLRSMKDRRRFFDDKILHSFILMLGGVDNPTAA